MARKTQISKEIILQAALELLIEKGFSEINIKTLSEKIGCSTQPIVWHFDNMDGLRIALGKYAREYANKKLYGDDGKNTFGKVGRAYIGIAIYEPNLFQFLYLSGKSELNMQNLDGIKTDEKNPVLIRDLSESLQISEKAASRYLQDIVIYTHGIAALAVAGVIKATESEIWEFVDNATNVFLLKARCENEKQ